MLSYVTCILCLIFVLITIILVSMKYFNALADNQEKLRRLTTYQINVNANIDTSIPELLNAIIQDAFTDYLVEYFIPANHVQGAYINEVDERKLIKGAGELVSTRISQAAIDKLSLFYNRDNIDKVITDKLYIIVTDYVAKNNANYVK